MEVEQSAVLIPFKGDARRLICADAVRVVIAEKETIQVWETESGKLSGELRGHKEVITSLQLGSLHGDPILLTGSKDKSIKIWNLVKNSCLYTLNGHSKSVVSVKMSGNRVVSGGSDHSIKIWDLASLRCVYSRKMEAQITSFDLTMVNPDVIYVQLSNGSLFKLNVETGDLSSLLTSSSAGGVSIGAEGEVYCGKTDGTIVMVEGAAKRAVKTFSGHTRHVERLRYYHPGFLVSSAKGEIKVWNVANGNCVVHANGEDFDLIETLASGATLLTLQSRGVFKISVQETIKALKVQNAISDANNAQEKEIFLAHCDLSSLPLELASHRSYQHITHLYLNNNMLTRLGTGLAKLKSLQVIQAQHNLLATVSSQLGKLSSLHTLLLGDNQLTYVPGEIGRLENLDLLDLSQNRLEYLPASLAALRELSTLFLHDNSLGGPDLRANEENQPHPIVLTTSPRFTPRNDILATTPSHSSPREESQSPSEGNNHKITSPVPIHPPLVLTNPSSASISPKSPTDSDSLEAGYAGSRMASSTSTLLSPRATSALLTYTPGSHTTPMGAANNMFGPAVQGTSGLGGSSLALMHHGASAQHAPANGITSANNASGSPVPPPIGMLSGGASATSLAQIPIASRNLSLRPTISSREAGPFRGHISSAKEAGSTPGTPHSNTSSPAPFPPHSASPSAAVSGAKSPRPLLTNTEAGYFGAQGNAAKMSKGTMDSPTASTPPSSGIIMTPTAIPTPRMKTANRSTSSTSASSASLHTSTITSTADDDGYNPSISPRKSPAPERKTKWAPEVSDKLSKDEIASLSPSPSGASLNASMDALSSPDHSNPTSPAMSKRRKRGKSSRPLKKKQRNAEPTSPSSSRKRRTLDDMTGQDDDEDSASAAITPESTSPRLKKKRAKKHARQSSSRASSSRNNRDDMTGGSRSGSATSLAGTAPTSTSPAPADPSSPSALSHKATTTNAMDAAEEGETTMYTPALKNASVRKSMNRYSTIKVSAKWMEQTMLESNLKEGGPMTASALYASQEISSPTILSAQGHLPPVVSTPQLLPTTVAEEEEPQGGLEEGVKSASKPLATPERVRRRDEEIKDGVASSRTRSASNSSPAGMRIPIDKIPARQQSTIMPSENAVSPRSASMMDVHSSTAGEGAKGKKKGKKRDHSVPAQSRSTDAATTNTASPTKGGNISSLSTSSETREVQSKDASKEIHKEFVSSTTRGILKESHSLSSGLSSQGNSSHGNSSARGISSSDAPHTEIPREAYLKEEEVKKQVYFEDVDFGQMVRLKLLHLQANKLETLPRSLGQCRSLTDLDLAENRLCEFPEWMCELSSLVRLSLACNEITKLPEHFTKLTRLVELYMDENDMEVLPLGVVKSFASMQVLHLSHNHLSSLPHGFGKLPNLTELNLSHNNFADFPSEVTMLKRLTFLALDSNDLRTLPSSLFFLPNLKSLEARDNMLTSVPYHSLIHLECLQLDNNLIPAITKDIAALHHILDLSFHHNPIREIPEEIGALSQLIRLDLSHMPIAQLPESICLLPKLRKLILHNNPNMTWPSPSLVAQLETEALLEAMVKSRFSSLKPNERHHVSFVGLQGSGKSSLFHYLKHAKGPKKNALKPTKGIEFDTWSPKPTWSALAPSTPDTASSPSLSPTLSAAHAHLAPTATANTSAPSASTAPTASSTPQKLLFNVWDFSGNEDYRLLHQMFLNEGSVFVLVWNLALDESRSTIDYWLNSIRCHAGPLAPVIIAATHLDNFRASEDQGPLQLLESKYLNSSLYPNVRGIIAVSAMTGENIEKLGKKICHLSIELRRGQKVPASFQKVMSSIPKDLPATPIPAPIMELQTVEKFFASKFGFDELTSAAALRYLHDVGCIINLSSMQFGTELAGVVVNPEWFVKIYSEIFSQRARFLRGSEGVTPGGGNSSDGKTKGGLALPSQASGLPVVMAGQEGLLRHDQLDMIWKDAGLPSLAHYTFIAVLHKLDMCLDDGNHLQKSSRNFYLNVSTFPTFLSEVAPENVPWTPLPANHEEIALVFRLSFIPTSLMPKLMCRIFSKLRPQSYWRYGFVVQSLPDVLQPNAEPEMSAFLELQPSHHEIHVWIRGTHMYSCMNLFIDSILLTLASYRSPPTTSIHRHLQCAFKTDKATQLEMVALTMHKVEYEISRGVTVLQLTTGGQIPLTHIHADMAEPITQFNTI